MSSIPEVAIGGLIALLGVLVAQLVSVLQARLERQHKREILLLTKYEELGLHFLDSMKLPHSMMMCSSTEDILALTHQVSGNKAFFLVLLYFPPLRQAGGRYVESYSELCLIAASLHDPEDERLLGMQVFDKPEYIEARNKYLAARDHLQDQIEIHAVSYAKS